jgi:sec-independent protein translocase protein TatB
MPAITNTDTAAVSATDLPAISESGMPAIDLPAIPTTPEAPTPETFVEADVHAAAIEPPAKDAKAS